MSKKEDKYLWRDADICIKCEEMTPTPKGNGFRPHICKRCAKKVKAMIKRLNKTGTYATGVTP